MFCVCVYANGSPDRIIGEPDECVDFIVQMTGMPLWHAKIHLMNAALAGPVSMSQPFDLYVEDLDGNGEAPFVYDCDPSQFGDMDDGI